MQLYEQGRKAARGNPLKQAAALAYYIAVRLFGMACFHYADRERDENNLAAAMAEEAA